jgi:hypothetical protein
MFHVRHLLALSLLVLAAPACGDPAGEDRTAGGQTGGEGQHSAPCEPELVGKDVSFDTAGPTAVSAAEALATFGPEHTARGTLEGRPDTTFRATLHSSGRAFVACKLLFVDVSLQLRSDDGAFDEAIPAQLVVYAADDATIHANYSSQRMQGSYRELLPAGEARNLSIGVSFSPDMSGWISLVPEAGGQSSVLAKF